MFSASIRNLTRTQVISNPSRYRPMSLRMLATLAPGLPKMQKAVVFEEYGGPLEYKDIPVPQPKANELLINVKYSGVCHTDLHVALGDWQNALPAKLPLVGGHEGAGVVVGMGENVKGWKLGDLAGIKWLNGSCMLCEQCEHGHEPNCDHADLSGCTHDGSFQQYATADAVQAAKLPQGVDMAKVAPILCAGITVYKALKTAGVQPGQWVAVSGAGGGLGSIAVQYAKAMGMRPIGIDIGADKEKLAKELGCEAFVDASKVDSVADAVIQATNGGAHGVINVSTSPKAIQQSVAFVRKNGTVVLVGLPPDAKIVADVLETVAKSVNIKGSYVGNRADSAEAIDFFARGLIDYPIHMAGLSELADVYKKMEEGKIVGRYVLDTSR